VVTPTVFPSLIVTFVSFIAMFAMAATGLVALPAGFEVALMCVFLATLDRPGRFGASGLRRGDILGLRQRSGAEQGDEGSKHDDLAHRYLLACVPTAYPASDGTDYWPVPLTATC
jgi:hypothetical protein